jgi:hypothetical protein
VRPAVIVKEPPPVSSIAVPVKTSDSPGLFAVLAVIAGGIAFVYFMVTKDDKPKVDAAAVVVDAAPMTVPLGSLIREYNDNEVRADSIYKGRVVAFYGYAVSIGKDILQDPYVTISERQSVEFPVVQCMASPVSVGRVSLISHGDQVKVHGKVSGKLGNLIIRECVFD